MPWAAQPARAQAEDAAALGGTASGDGAVRAGDSARSGGTAAGLAAAGTGLVPGGVPTQAAEAPVRLGGFFGFPFGSPLGGPVPLGGVAPSRSWTVIPSIGARVMATDNAFQGSGGKAESDVITSIAPDLLVVADSARVQGSIGYAPTLQIYANNSSQDRVDHRLNGVMVATVLPGAVFLDMRASAAVVPIAGNQAAADDTTLSRDNRSQTFNLSLSPYYVQRFGGLATSLIGYTYQYSRQGGRDTSLTPGGPIFFNSEDLTSHTGYAALRTGEDFGPLAMEARVSGTSYTGGGVLDGGHRASAVLETRYAFSRAVTGLVEAGYEDQEYGGVTPVNISEPIWGAGVRLDLGPGTQITARLQRRDGFTAPRLDARVALGARTVLFASYSDQLNTYARLGADLLNQTSLDALGNPIDTQTGAPARDVSGNGLLAAQNGLFRSKRAAVTLTQVWDRDSVSLDGTWEERIPVTTLPGQLAFRQESPSVGLSWSHLISERTSFIASGRYGRTSSSGAVPDGDTYSARATLAFRFNPTLTGSLQYLLTNRSTEYSSTGAGFGSGDTLQNAVTASLRKTF